jgi:uncharacterized delta-60 repeat protein
MTVFIFMFVLVAMLGTSRADGELDLTFGAGTGKVVTDFSGDSESASAVAIDSMGRIVAAGQAGGRVFDQSFALARYNPDGSLDPSFGNQGTITTRFPDMNISAATAVAIQPDGRILAAGWAGNGSRVFCYHPGPVFNVVTRGTVTVEDGCGGDEVFTQGQGFEKIGGRIHRAKNFGTVESFEYNAFVVPEGSPITVNIPNNERLCGPPRSVPECKDGGWMAFSHPRRFANQGDCLGFVLRGN